MFLQYHTAFYTVIITDNKKISGVLTCTGKKMCMSDSQKIGHVHVICKNSLPVDMCSAIVKDIVENLSLGDIRQKYAYLHGSPLDSFVTKNYEKIKAIHADLTVSSYETIQLYHDCLLKKETLIRQDCENLVDNINNQIQAGRSIDNLGDLEYASRFVRCEVRNHMEVYERFLEFCNVDFSDLQVSESCISLTCPSVSLP